MDETILTLLLLVGGLTFAAVLAGAFKPLVRLRSRKGAGGTAEDRATSEAPGARKAARLAHVITVLSVTPTAVVLALLNVRGAWSAVQKSIGWPETVWRENVGFRLAPGNAWSNAASPPWWLLFALGDLLICAVVLLAAAILCEWLLRRGVTGLRRVSLCLLAPALICLSAIVARWVLWPLLYFALPGAPLHF